MEALCDSKEEMEEIARDYLSITRNASSSDVPSTTM